MYSLNNGLIYKTFSTNECLVTELVGNLNKIQLPQQVETTLSQMVEIVPVHLVFDLEAGEYVTDTTNTTPIELDVNGQTITLQVGEPLEFSSEELGIFTIRSINNLIGNTSCEVVVNG